MIKEMLSFPKSPSIPRSALDQKGTGVEAAAGDSRYGGASK
jgi:hypothetical protein